MPPKPRKAKAPKAASPPPPPSVPEWDRNSKEVWHLEFEKEAINDDRWTCIVAAAVQAEDKDEECILMYTQSVNAGLRRAVKIITMADVTALIKEHVKVKKENETSKPGKGEKSKTATVNVNVPSPSPIIELVAKYALITDMECQLPPDLMAAVVKFLIIKLKDENSYKKKMEAIRAKKLREQNIREKFIREKKPFEKRQEQKSYSTSRSSALLAEPINDEPIDGPDLYIMLVGFYDVAYLQEMLKMNIPLVALLKILTTKYKKDDADDITPPSVAEVARKRTNQITAFWDKLKQECQALETTATFKDMAMMQYTAPSESSDLKEHRKVIFDELTWTLYSAHCIQRQHQKYLQEMQVQKVILSLETLDLNKCSVYNKLCDALITGEPLSFLIVLYAIVEQVVAGVPETQRVALEYHHPKHSMVTHARRRTTIRKRRFTKMSRSIIDLKDKIELSPDKHKESSTHWTAEGSDNSMEGTSTTETRKKGSVGQSREKVSYTPEYQISETLVDQVLTERKTEKELKADKKWKTPFLCSHGDSIFMQTFYCDPRLFDPKTVVSRFLGNSDFFNVWNKFPELTPEEKVYYNYHFFSLWKISGQREDLLKTKIFFLLAMKFMGITKSYVYKGVDENISLSLSNGRERQKDIAKMTYDVSLIESLKGRPDSFSNYFLKTFIVDMYHKRAVISKQDSEWESFKTESEVLMKITSHLNVFHVSRCSVPFCQKTPQVDKNLPTEPALAKVYHTLYFLLDCLDITNLTESHFVVGNEFHLNAIKSFKFYEKLESHLMMQRVLEAAENFNTIQYWHFLPTDTLIINMHDDFDHRGLFYTIRRGALPTPVALRDFYNYVYPEIGQWLVNESKQHSKFLTDLAEKLKAQEEKEDAQYLAFLNLEYDKLSPEKQEEFLETLEEQQVEYDENDMYSLPRKRKPPRSKKISFITTNLMDMRVENNRKINEFHSLDGTKVNFSLDSWLYQPSSVLMLEVKRSDFLLYYHQIMGQEINTSFSFKTLSGIIFSFYKNNEEEKDSKYYVTMSWPTGLLIRPVWIDSTVYVKQFYLKPCRKGSKIEEEESRCFLKNGNVVVFKSNGDYDVLCASGTKYSFYDSATIPRYEIVSTTGEVWEIRTKGPCRNRKKLISRNKIFIGFDPKTCEAFYKREDGVQCMLWQSGRLVTNYPDGTKITSTPYFDEDEVNLEWTEEEKNYFEKLVYRFKSEQSVQEPRSRTILRRSSTSRTIEAKPFEFEGFTSISCAYLTEHPKYSTVHINRNYPDLRVTLPESININIREEGTYEIQKDKHFLRVEGTEVVFQTICYDCPDTSTLKLNLDSSDILCSFVDFFRKAFNMNRNGTVTFQETQKEEDTPSDHRSNSTYDNVFCASRQIRGSIAHHRCFVLERDLSGIEFLHEDYVADHIARHSAPDPHHLLFHSNLQSEDGEYADIGHILTGQYTKAGYEKWVMEYEDPLDSLPVNIKKKDLKELGTKHVTKNLFQYPFPKSHSCVQQQPKEKAKKNINAPKLIVNRIILCLSPNPNSIITELKNYVVEYQNQALKIFKSYKTKKPKDEREHDPRYIDMRLRKIAITLNQSLHMYPHLCTQLPSTEKDIHYFGHLINKAEELKFQPQEDANLLPECKQIPVFPRFREFESIPEENETNHN